MFSHRSFRNVVGSFILLNGVFVLVAFLLGRQLGQSYHVSNIILSVILPLAGLAEMWGQIVLFSISRIIAIKTKWLPSDVINWGILAIGVSLGFIMTFAVEGFIMIVTAPSMLHIVVITWIALNIACTVVAIHLVSHHKISEWSPILSVGYGVQILLLVLWKMTF